jgi:V-type H+-transporting ATPase subunit a
MFGDLAHGSALCIIGILLCLFADWLKKNVPALELFVRIRYLLTLMGFFAAFNGLIYNDFAAIPIIGFGGTCYKEQWTYDHGIDVL